VRDEPTAELLRAQGVAAQAPGNVIVDLVRDSQGGANPLPTSIGILPGSRAEAYEDGLRLARVVRELAGLRPGLSAIFSIAATLDAARFEGMLAGDGWTIAPGAGERPFEAIAPGARLIAWSGPLGELLRASTVVLGQAGTANEQAAAFGVPVVALAGAADREDWYRMRQRRLLGEALTIVPSDPARAARSLDALLRDGAALERMRLAGPQRLGGTGGAAAIARAVLELA
jgi:uncharacterized protein (TIGR03492 family)